MLSVCGYSSLKAWFHEPAKHANESRLEANDQKCDLCHRLVWSANQYPFIFPLNFGQQLDTDRPIESDLFCRSERLVRATKQSSDRSTKHIRHVKYFGQKPQPRVDLSATLDAQESILVVGSQENIWSASGTVISESQRPNLSL